MRKVLVIAVREYLAAVRTKAFWVGILIMPLLFFGGVVVQFWFKKQSDLAESRYAVIDRTPGESLWPILDAAVKYRNQHMLVNPETKKPIAGPFKIEKVTLKSDAPEALAQERLALSERVKSGELNGFLEIGPDVEKPIVSLQSLAFNRPMKPLNERLVLRFQSNKPMAIEFSRWAEQVLSAVVEVRRANKAGLSLMQAGSVLQPVPLVSKGLSEKNSRTGRITEDDADNPLSAIMLPMSLTILMLMMLMVGTSPLMQSVIEEKMQRIAEVLLGSVDPFQLMVGKLIGMVGVSLTTVAVYLVGAYAAGQKFGMIDQLSPAVLGWFVLFLVLGVVMYGSLFIAIGAACTDAKEAQTLLMPVMLVATAPIFALGHLLREPNSALATGLSFFPFATPMLMTSRIAMPSGLPLWQPLVGVVVVLVTTGLCVFAAGRIFRVGLLMQGKGAHLAEIARWVLRG